MSKPTWQDPHAGREAERYENPIPSRELILELLVNGKKALAADEIAAHFGLVDEDQTEALRRRSMSITLGCMNRYTVPLRILPVKGLPIRLRRYCQPQ